MIKILVVEDEELIFTMLKLNLEKEGYCTECVRSAEAMLERISQESYDIVLLDIMLPGMSGDKALEMLRRKGVNVPVIMLTAKNDLDTKVKTLDCGADDYLSKPFNMQELIARVKALIRRSRSERTIPSDGLYRINRSTINFEERKAVGEVGEITLTEKEAELLNLFVRNPRRTLSRAEILEEVWGMDVYPTPRTIDNFILKFRKLFEDKPEKPKHFITVRATGYRFDP